MKATRWLLTLLLVSLVLSQPVSYSTFLSRLDSHESYHQTSLLERLEQKVPNYLKDEHEMQYEIVRAFVSQYFYRSKLSIGEVYRTFEEFFGRFKQRWLINMQDTIIRELELDISDPAHLKEIRSHPELYSINYETFKILSFKG